MKNITNLVDNDITKTYNRLVELNWPTKNFLDNTLNMEIKEVSQESFMERIDYDLLEQYADLMDYSAFRLYATDCALKRDLVRLASYKTTFIDDKEINKLVDNNPFIFNRDGLLNIIEATNYYLATVIFENDKTPVIIDSCHQYLTVIMALIINKIGINKFVWKYFNNDYSCFTKDIALTYGTKLTRDIYQYAEGVFKYKEVPEDIIDRLVDAYGISCEHIFRSLRVMAGRSLNYQEEHSSYNDKYKIIVEKKKVRLLERFNPFK